MAAASTIDYSPHVTLDTCPGDDGQVFFRTELADPSAGMDSDDPADWDTNICLQVRANGEALHLSHHQAGELAQRLGVFAQTMTAERAAVGS